jgi:uncharacterized protein
MLIVISPSKTLDFESPVNISEYSNAEFGREANELAAILKKHSLQKLSALMGISPKLARLNYERYQQWNPELDGKMGRQALFAFRGDVYEGLQATSLSESDYSFAQNHLLILSGLYGVLKPLDLIQPYRLEMGAWLKTRAGKDLYDYWRKKITISLNSHLKDEKSGILINLSSIEYFSAIEIKKLKARIISPRFLDFNKGSFKVVSFYAKRARGLMSRFIVQNKIDNPDHLVAFNEEGYNYDNQLSKGDNLVFTR